MKLSIEIEIFSSEINDETVEILTEIENTVRQLPACYTKIETNRKMD